MSSIFSFIILTINRGFKHRSCFISAVYFLCVSRTFAISFRFTASRFSSFALRIHESPPHMYHNGLHLSILKLSIDTSSFFKETIPPPLSSILSTWFYDQAKEIATREHLPGQNCPTLPLCFSFQGYKSELRRPRERNRLHSSIFIATRTQKWFTVKKPECSLSPSLSLSVSFEQ